eukprot:CAMPEP_0115005974 /NCGR_PEP_ID=MMETSP0216-20121206/20207_1 /TAXON_ID=223996 /ORGANISM="Protocruzia adherens, Strain Boccale" /LENGTH=112 /DNA_ID=CAMNT_0002372435 /DNA_START=236 /DNA_END=574 /DNA_ORIENTATION=+
MAIFGLNSFLGFISPAEDPEEEEDLGLPRYESDEFRPFRRKVIEYDFWLSLMIIGSIGFFCTFFEEFNLKVHGLFLLCYYVFVMGLALHKRIKHMIKYKYIPISFGKQRYSK